MMEIRTALKCFNQRKCRFLTPCFYVCKRPVSISVKRGFYARKIPAVLQQSLPNNKKASTFVKSNTRIEAQGVKPRHG